MGRRASRIHLLLQELAERIGTSFWFVPMLLLIGALVLAVITLVLDATFFESQVDTPLLVRESKDAALQLLSTLAGATITVAGVVFSVMIVALSMASQQFGPRLLRNFVRDRANQFTIGIFLGSFAFHLAVLSQIREAWDEGTFVPPISILTSLVLGLITFFTLIYFIHHMAMLIQVENIVQLVAKDLDATICETFPAEDGKQPAPEELEPLGRQESAGEVTIGKSGYIELIEMHELVELAGRCDLLIKLKYRAGHYILDRSVAALIWPGDRLTDEIRETIRDAFAMYHRRTPEQDVEFCLTQLVQIACKALSTALNDPFTAITCIDALSESLAEVLARRPWSPWHFDDAGRLRVVSNVIEFDGLLGAAFNMIRQMAANNVPASLGLLAALVRMAELAERDEDRLSIARHVEMVADTILQSPHIESLDREKVRQCQDEARRLLGGKG